MTNRQLKNITLNDLEKWAGSTLVSRGKEYHSGGSVSELVYDPTQESLVAQVSGSRDYTTQVSLTQDGSLSSRCTCPYGGTCKHAVAVVLEYLEQIKQGAEIGSTTTISEYLQQQTREQLIALLEQLSLSYPTVAKFLRQRATPSTKKGAQQALISLRKEIARLKKDADYADYGYSINPHHFEQRLQELLTHGYADELISVAQEVVELGALWMERSGEEDISVEITECVSVVFDALPQCSLSTVEKMLWVIDMEQQDEFDLCSESMTFWRTPFSTTDWSQVADVLLARIRAIIPKEISTSEYRFDQLVRRLLEALERAGRDSEIIPLFRQELLGKTSESYLNFVHFLQQAGLVEEALQWIHRGIAATLQKAPGIAQSLRNVFQEILEKGQQWDQITAMIAEDFFDRPSLEKLETLQQWAEKSGTLPQVRAAALHYLETGNLPFRTAAWTLPPPPISMLRDQANESSESWSNVILRPSSKFPNTSLLIRLAVAEKRFDDVVRWFNIVDPNADRWDYEPLAEYVAKTVITTHPDVAIPIFKTKAEQLIGRTNVSAYAEAITRLEPVRTVLLSLGREGEWLTYVEKLRDDNIRKYRLVELIDAMEPKVKKTASPRRK